MEKVFDTFSGINIVSGFKLQSEIPLDPRTVVDSLEVRDALVEEKGAYEGMQVYVKAEKTTYCLKDLTAGSWEEVGTGAGGASGNVARVILVATDWNSDNLQTVPVSGVTKDSIIFVSPDGDPTAYTNAGIYCVDQDNGSLTFSCKVVPDLDVKANILRW